jgi:hypothetical protein
VTLVNINRQSEESFISFTSTLAFQASCPTDELPFKYFSNEGHALLLLALLWACHFIINGVEEPHHKFVRIMMIFIVEKLIQALNALH